MKYSGGNCFFCRLKVILKNCAAAGLDLSRAEAVGSGRACQRPRTSSGAKCFSCEGALAREIAFLKFLAINVALGGASFFSERSPSGARADGARR